ncbi:RMD1 family protein [Thiosocius teredinicola]|uniref:RMD1 family protein n=1 Tax=Thiosocius teredinicola TaxID=1973002 RepID=UPI000990AC14
MSQNPSPRLAHAVLLGHRINVRPLLQTPHLSGAPVAVEVSGGGLAVVLRFGVVVFFDVSPIGQTQFIDALRPYVSEPIDQGEFETLEFTVESGSELLHEGVLLLDNDELPTLQVVADVLAKSVVLDHHEHLVAATFDRVEPLAEQLSSGSHRIRQSRSLVAHIGEMLRVQHRMVGRAEIGEKPDIIWEHPDRERLFVRLEQEFEIRERRSALDRKLNLISTTAETLLDLVQAQRTLRVEWYIVILIVVEIGLTLYELFLH